MRLGYNTNGFAHHRFEDAIEILAEIGYESIAITLDHGVLNPFEPELERRVQEARRLLERHGLHSVVETGARFLLDCRVKHHPTLMDRAAADCARRMEFLHKAIDIAAGLGSDAMSFWSGTLRDTTPDDEAMDRLASRCRELADYAAEHRVRLGFEPEPGMYIARMRDFDRLRGKVNHPMLGLTLDIGHVHCLDDGAIPAVIEHWGWLIANVHIEDMRRGVHDHLMFGEGEIDFPPTLRQFNATGYAGGIHVELSRHSHDAVETARRAFQFLEPLCG